MFNAENAQNIAAEISRLYSVMENQDSYTEEECSACEILYAKMTSLSVELAVKKCTDEKTVINDITEKGFGTEAESFSDAEKDAFRLVGDTEKFRNYCYYRIIRLQLDMIADVFEIQ